MNCFRRIFFIFNKNYQFKALSENTQQFKVLKMKYSHELQNMLVVHQFIITYLRVDEKLKAPSKAAITTDKYIQNICTHSNHIYL